VLVRALQRDPLARFESALAMGRALSGLIQDPISAREGLTHFQDQMTALDESAKRTSAGRAAVSREPVRQEEEHVSLTSQAGEPGLPLAFGDVERPVRPVRRMETPAQERAPVDYERLLVPIFFVIAVCILAFTSIRLWGEDASETPAASSEVQAIVNEVEPEPVEQPVARPAPESVAAARVEQAPDVVEPVAAPSPKPVPVEIRTEAPISAPTTLPGEGHITISSIPTARVYVDGEFVRTTPVFRFQVDAGSRQIELRAKDGRTHRFQLSVRDGADLNRVWSFEESKFVGN